MTGNFSPGFSLRSPVCRCCRIQYEPVWSPSLPWLVFRRGTQTVNKATAEEAINRILKYNQEGGQHHDRYPG